MEEEGKRVTAPVEWRWRRRRRRRLCFLGATEASWRRRAGVQHAHPEEEGGLAVG